VTNNLLTPREAAAILRVSLDTLEGYVLDGTLAFVNVGRGTKRPRRRFSLVDIERFIADRTKRLTPSPSISTPDRRNTRSPSTVVGFMAARAARLAEKQRQRNEKKERTKK
jgi:excisionase family DNA binding protein